MSKVKELSEFMKEKGRFATLSLLHSFPVYISEKLSSCNFYLQKSNEKIVFYKGDGRREITIVDRTLNRLYEHAIKHFEENSEIYSHIPSDWKFAFDYFPTNSPAKVQYDNVPESRLVLNRIMVQSESGKTTKVIDDPTILEKWSNLLKVEEPNSIFYGRIDKDKATDILSSLEISESIAVETIFRTFGATPQLNESIESVIDSFLFRVYQKPGKKPILFKVSFPIHESLNESSKYGSHDTTSLLVLDFLDFVNGRSLKAESIISTKPDERYLEMISYLFEEYYKKKASSLTQVKFENGEFATDVIFDLNEEAIRNPEVFRILKESDSNKKAFQIILNSFRMRKNESSNPLFTKSLIDSFNSIVERIKKITEAVPDKDFMTYKDYMKLKELNESLYSNETVNSVVKKKEDTIGTLLSERNEAEVTVDDDDVTESNSFTEEEVSDDVYKDMI